jgi:hypothetical protein
LGFGRALVFIAKYLLQSGKDALHDWRVHDRAPNHDTDDEADDEEWVFSQE